MSGPGLGTSALLQLLNMTHRFWTGSHDHQLHLELSPSGLFLFSFLQWWPQVSGLSLSTKLIEYS